MYGTKYASAEDAAVERERRDRRDREVLAGKWVDVAIQGHPELIERVRAPRPRLQLLLSDMDRIEAKWAREGFKPGKRLRAQRNAQRAKMEDELTRGTQRERTLLRELVAAYEVALGQRELAPAQHLVGYCRDRYCTACGWELCADPAQY